MNARKASELVGITYGQLRYFVRQIDALTKKETSQGHDHEFTFRDLVYLKLAALMREDGLRLDEINKGIYTLNGNWINAENPTNAGVLTRIPPGKKPKNDREKEMEEDFDQLWREILIKNIREADEFYLASGPRPVMWLWSSYNPWILKEEKSLNHIPGLMYSAMGIASELADDNQLELEFNPGKEVYEETQVK